MKEHLKHLNHYLLDLITRGRYASYDIDVIRQIRLLNIGTVLGIIVLLALGIVAFIQGNTLLGAIDCGLILVLCIVLFYARQSQNYRFAFYAVIGFYTLMCAYLLMTGGAYQTGYVWYFTFPLIACFGLGSRKGAIATAILMVPTLLLFSLDNPPGIIAAYTVNFKIRFVSAFFMIAALAYVVERVREDTQTRLEAKNTALNRAIADLHLADQKLRQVGEDLEKRVEERTHQLAVANRHLRQEIKDRRQAEEALRESEEKYRLIAENTADVIAIMDMNLRLTYISPSARRLQDVPVDELKEQTLDRLLTPDSLQRALAVFTGEMAREGTADPGRIRIMELELYKMDGSRFWVETSFSLLRDKDGKAIAILTVSRDISERKRAEEETKLLSEQLQQAQKLESIGTLAGGIAHDFNNLLMSIQGYVTLIRLDLDASHPHYERLQEIEQQVASGANLTRQLLGFAQKGRYEVKVTDMNNLIDKTSSMFNRTKKEISIKKHLETNLWRVRVDIGQMEQVLINLYLNAGQAMPAGGTLKLETENVYLNNDQARPHAVEPGKYVKITVSDNGIGMDEKTLQRIFDPFFTTKGMGRGTGLGLAMVYGIIKGHAGMIDVTSIPGRGTTFTLHLPASDEAMAAVKPVSKAIPKGTETILIVDDEKVVLDVNRQILEALGYGVYAARSGQEAIAYVLENPKEISMVILDMVMPGMSGGDTFDRLRAINPDIPVILSSGYSIDGEAQQILGRGCNSFLQKPFEVEHLSQQIRDILDPSAS